MGRYNRYSMIDTIKTQHDVIGSVLARHISKKEKECQKIFLSAKTTKGNKIVTKIFSSYRSESTLYIGHNPYEQL